MEYEAVIVGAGPVGLLLACELGLAGVRTAVLERLKDSNIPTRAAGLGDRGLNVASMEVFYRRGMMEELHKSAAVWFGKSENGRDRKALLPGPQFRFAGHFAGI